MVLKPVLLTTTLNSSQRDYHTEAWRERLPVLNGSQLEMAQPC